MILSMLEGRRAGLALLALLAVWLPFAAMFHGIDYDESQYVGAVALMPKGLPFRDFFYLQTPLQPLLLAPLAWLAEGHLFVALRLANAAMLGATLLLVYHAILTHGGSRGQARLAVALMALCEPVIFIGSVARNDAMPLLFETIAVVFLLRHWQTPGPRWSFALAGLFMGAAISAKLQFSLVGLAAGLVMLANWRRMGLPAIGLFLAGGIVGCLPIALFWAMAPDAFLFGVFEYAAKAPWQWYHLGDRGEMFMPHVILVRLLRFTAMGPTLIVIGLVIRSRLRGESAGKLILLLDILIVAGLIAGILPQPIYRQYLAPLYPVLFIRFGLTPLWWPRRMLWRGLFLVSTFAALAETVCIEGGDIFPNAVHAASPPVDTARDSRWIATVVPAGARVAGLSPERYVDSGLAIDHRFATGPFIFRTEGLVSAAQAKTWHVVPRAQMDSLFASDPPDVLVAGGYRKQEVASPPRGLDHYVEQWARENGWRAIQSPSGAISIYLRPGLPSGADRTLAEQARINPVLPTR